jgi:S-adenosylmethionine hydrolase
VKVITLTSDYGANTYYAASLKARIIELIPDAMIVDVSHNLPAYDLLQGAFLLQSCINDFKSQTVHIIAIDTNLLIYSDILIGKMRNQWVIAADNGFLSMLSDEWDVIYKVNPSVYSLNDLSPEKNTFSILANFILTGVDLNTFAKTTTPKIIFNSLKPVITDSQIRASIVHVDGYDNAVTNLNNVTFFNWIGNADYKIFYRKRESLAKIDANYANVAQGDGVAVFNDVGWLEIAINRGQGKSLLGLKLGDQIIIEKQE